MSTPIIHLLILLCDGKPQKPSLYPKRTWKHALLDSMDGNGIVLCVIVIVVVAMFIIILATATVFANPTIGMVV